MNFQTSVAGLPPRLKLNIAGFAAEGVAFAVAPNMPIWFKRAAPKLRERLINSVARQVMIPHLERAESLMENMFRSKELLPSWEAAKAEGAEAKAHFMAEHAVDLGVTFPGSFISSMATNWALEQNVMKQEFSLLKFMGGALIEGGVHLGVIIGGPKLLPNQFASLKSWTCKFMEKHGKDPEAAESFAQNFVYSSIGDGLGFVANMTVRTLLTPKQAAASI